MKEMDVYQKYFFDLNGYLVIEDALSPKEVAACNEAIDANQDSIQERTGEKLLSGKSSVLKGEQGRGDLGSMLTWPHPWCEPFRDLLAHPNMVPVLLEILRDGFRLDHYYGIVMREGTEGHVLHGSGTDPYLTKLYQFHNGRMRCGLTVVAWVLTDCGPGDGGFACIPGSHKANYPTPEDVQLLERDIGVVRQVEAKAGSVIVFTECLTHGTLPWKAAHERRSILFKYNPGTLAHSGNYMPEDLAAVLDEFTPAQRAVLEPPYRRSRPSVFAE